MKLLTPTEVATKLGVSRACVHQWINEGRIAVTDRLANGQCLIAPRDARRPKPLKRGPKPRA